MEYQEMINRARKYSDAADFFRSYCLDVRDRRDKGGALWVVGDSGKIGRYVSAACVAYHIFGSYTDNGRTTNYHMSWYTNAGRVM